MTRIIPETAIGAVYGKRLAGNLKDETRAWVHPLPSDLPLPKVLVVPAHPTGQSEFIAMSSNPTNPPIEDQFLRWRQEMKAKQEEQARQMAELREHADHLQ